MRNPFLCLLAVVATAGLVIATGCEGPEGPAGTAECFSCHTENSEIDAIEGQWANSVHATGTNFERNTTPCKDCHTHEGFVEKVSGGDLDETNSSNIHCFTCHKPHTDKNFGLRTSTAVSLERGGTFNLGDGNLCANCHQARVPAPDFTAIATGDSIKSPYWGPHHGPQASILAGTGGYEFSSYSPGYNDSPHTSMATGGCPTCHMATPYGAQAGGHTMKMTYEYHGHETGNVAGCNTTTCHGTGGLSDFNYKAVEDSIAANMAALRTKLLAAALIDSTDHVVASSSSPLGLTQDQAGAVYNYLLLLEDRSNGVHNYKYALALLKASMAALP